MLDGCRLDLQICRDSTPLMSLKIEWTICPVLHDLWQLYRGNWFVVEKIILNLKLNIILKKIAVTVVKMSLWLILYNTVKCRPSCLDVRPSLARPKNLCLIPVYELIDVNDWGVPVLPSFQWSSNFDKLMIPMNFSVFRLPFLTQTNLDFKSITTHRVINDLKNSHIVI